MQITSVSLDNHTFGYDNTSELNVTLRGENCELRKIYYNLLENRGDFMLNIGDCNTYCCADCMGESYTQEYGRNSNGQLVKAPMFGGAFFDENNDLIYIKEVLYNAPATIVFWSDGDKTISKCAKDDTYNAEMGLALAVMKKLVSNEFVTKTLHDWLPVEGRKKRTLTEVRKEHKDVEKETKPETESRV